MKLDQLIIQVVVGFPKWIMGFFILLLIGALLLLPGLKKDPSPYLLPSTHESRVNLAQLRNDFTGSNNSIMVLLEAPETVFNPETLTRIQQLTRAFEKIHLVRQDDRDQLHQLSKLFNGPVGTKLEHLAKAPIGPETWMILDEVRELLEPGNKNHATLLKEIDAWSQKVTPVIEVTSLSNTDNILAENGRLDVDRIYDQAPDTEEDLKRLERQTMANDLFTNILVDSTKKHTGIVIELIPLEDRTQDLYYIYQQVEQIVKKKVPGPETHYIAGMPVVTGALGTVMQQDTQRLFPIVVALVMLCLFVTFRKITGVIVPLAVVLLSLVVTLALKSFLGIPLNIITTTLPVFILSIGVADGIHMFSEYRDQLAITQDRQDAVVHMISRMCLPVIMTSLTTAAAFYAISLTQIVQMKHFGIFVSIGTLLAMIFSLFFVPALLLILPHKKSTRQKREKKASKPGLIDTTYSNLLISGTKKVLQYPIITLTLTVLVFVVFLFGAFKVKVDNNNAHYFLKDAPILISSEKINQNGAGSSIINLLIESNSREAAPFKKPENLAHVNALVNFADSHPVVGKVMGLTELIKRINYVLNDNDPDHDRIPTLKTHPGNAGRMISQLLLLYENAGGDALSDYTDTGYTRLNVVLLLKTNSSREISRVTQEIQTFVRQSFPPHLKVRISGSANVAVAATDEIVAGQMKSLIVSFAVVFVMLMATFRRISHALIAMIPLATTICINFGIMGFGRIPLDIGTAIISSIVIGIGVDYSIHYLSRLNKNLKNGRSFDASLANTVRHSGKAIVSNALTVGLGFIALLFSQLTPLITMGWMISITMMVSAVSTLILIPLFIRFFEKEKTSDVQEQTIHRITYSPMGKNA